VILLAGLGSTAHVFDDFAPKLAARAHVYGVTRRGFGASSDPLTGYDANRLGDDVVAVIAALKLDRPVLAAHSISGQELSSVATRWPARVAGLAYMEAAYAYAYYDAASGDIDIDVAEFHRTLNELEKQPASASVRERLRSWRKLADSIEQADDEGDEKRAAAASRQFDRNRPALERNLRAMRDGPAASAADAALNVDLPALRKDLDRLLRDLREETDDAPDPKPGKRDLASVDAYRAWETRVHGFAFPEAEVRQIFVIKPNGGIGRMRFDAAAQNAIERGERKFGPLPAIPIVAIYAMSTTDAIDVRETETQARAFARAMPQARIVRLQGANHNVFLSNETDVLAELERLMREVR